MNCEVNQVIQVTLTMTATEALWLKEITQNPMCDEGDDRIIRTEMFNALPSFKVLTAAVVSEQAPKTNE